MRFSTVATAADASNFARTKIVDLLISSPPLEGLDLEGRVLALTRDPNLGRSAAIHLHWSTEDPSKLKLHRSIKEMTALLPADSSPADLLVKASTLLRLRKMEAQQRQNEADVASSNLRLRDLTARFQRELEEAKEIQKSILPTNLPKTEAFVFAAAYLPVDTVGGDLYDVWQISDGRFGLLIADVTGHGLPAAFIGAMTKMAVANATSKEASLMLEEVNGSLEKIMPEGRFVTAAAAILDSTSGELEVACAGHPPPIIVRADGAVEVPAIRGLPLGVTEGVHYEKYVTNLEAKASALFVTDGITETQGLVWSAIGSRRCGRSI